MIKVERFGSTKCNALFIHCNRLKYIDNLNNIIRHSKIKCDEMEHENKRLKIKLQKRANRQFEIESENAQLNEKIQGILYDKEYLKVYIEEKRKKIDNKKRD